jgi:hypothetical protein
MLAKYNRPMTPREKRIRNQFGAMFIISTLTALWLMVIWSNQDIENSKQKVDLGVLQHQNDSLRNQFDSLRDETFNLSNALGRYELTLEYLKEIDPKAAKKFNDYMSHETE